MSSFSWGICSQFFSLVARHLGNLSISAAPPSYVHPYASVPSNASYHQSRFPQYPEYSQEFTQLANPQQSSYAASFTEKAREEVVYHLAGQGSLVTPPYYHTITTEASSRMYANYQAPPQWPPVHPRHSTYQTTPFGQSVIQHTSPSASYPTPPPPGISASSSSLAGALGPAPPRPIRHVYQPKDSPAFFNNFLNQTPVQPPPRAATAPHIQSLRYHQQPSTPLYEPPPPTQQSRSQPIPLADIPLVDLGSPDPLEIAPTEPDHLKVTPKKRKVEQYLESPKVKRVQVTDSARSSVSPLQPRGQQQRNQPPQPQGHSHLQRPPQSQPRQQPPNQQTPPRPQIGRKHSSFEIAIPSPSKHKKPHTPTGHGSNNQKPPSFPSSSSSGSGFSSGSGSQPYVAVPPHPKAYHTPKSQKKERLEVVITTTSLSAKAKGKVRSADEDDDLGGFGSEEDSTSLSFSRSSASVKSSAKRATGDRDERGMHCYAHIRSPRSI